MAGGAFSFADVLRDEYVYLHGASPNVCADITSKHLRELPRLVLKVKGAAEDTAKQTTLTRYALLKRHCTFSDPPNTAADCDAVTAALQKLVTLERVDVPSNASPVSLYEALLLDPDAEVAARLRDPEILRKLIRIPNARRMVFADRQAANIVASSPELRVTNAAGSAVIRLLEHPGKTPGGQAMLTAYPALLATIADDDRLRDLLGDEKRRQELVKLFALPEARPWYSRLFSGSHTPTAEALQALSRDPRALEARLTGTNDIPQRPAIPESALKLFNAIVLETAFPDHFADSFDIRSLNTAMHEKNTAALCLSGGGIRSATFNLGVLQGLADHGLLSRFHYLSTVSGGGYIGSWLSSWIRRHNEGAWGVAKDLSAPPADPEEPEPRPIQHLREYSSYLAPRSASLSADTWTLIATYVRNLLLNWTMLLPAIAAVLALPRLLESTAYAATALRSPFSFAIVTMALGVVAIFSVAALRPKNESNAGGLMTDEEIRERRARASRWMYPLCASAAVFCLYWASLAAPPPVTQLAWLLSIASAVAALVYMSRHLYSLVTGASTWQRIRAAFALLKNGRTLRHSLGEIASAAAAGFLAGLLLRALFAGFFPPAELTRGDTVLRFETFICFGIPLFLLAFFVEATLMVGLTTLRTTDHDREWWARSAALIMLAAVVWIAGAGIALVVPFLLAQLPVFISSMGGVAAALSWLIARSKTLRSKEDREKTSAVAMRTALHLAAAFVVTIVLAAISLGTSAILSYFATIENVGAAGIFRSYLTSIGRLHMQVLHQVGPWTILGFIGAATVVAGVMSLLLHVNVYSMHGMYRNRLIRAYLGASRWFRRPDPFTGFDPHDNVDMFELRAEALWSSSYIDFDEFIVRLTKEKTHIHDQLPAHVRERIEAYLGPQKPPMAELRSEVTRALNELMSTSDIRHAVPAPPNAELFAENRRYLDLEFEGVIVPAPFDTGSGGRLDGNAQALVPADATADERMQQDLGQRTLDEATPQRQRPPLHVVNAALNLVAGDNLAWQERKADSFTISPLHAGNRRLGYRDSFEYGEHISLGTALAISGAAVSPNMGYNSSPALTFLMTLFNARLGWWLGNPARDTFRKMGPASTLQNLCAELLGATHDRNSYVFLSDGGHFDNLGLYEMVRRRCRYIVASDATADSKYAFADLGNAVRKIRVDMGIPIHLHTSYLPAGPDERAGRYCAVGRIEYSVIDDVKEDGYLLYIKPAVDSDCPPDVRNYKKESASFPHETTIDQFFCESQFESYRALGRHMVGKICGDKIGSAANQADSVPQFLGWALQEVQEARTLPVEVRLVE